MRISLHSSPNGRRLLRVATSNTSIFVGWFSVFIVHNRAGWRRWWVWCEWRFSRAHEWDVMCDRERFFAGRCRDYVLSAGVN